MGRAIGHVLRLLAALVGGLRNTAKSARGLLSHCCQDLCPLKLDKPGFYRGALLFPRTVPGFCPVGRVIGNTSRTCSAHIRQNAVA